MLCRRMYSIVFLGLVHGLCVSLVKSHVRSRKLIVFLFATMPQVHVIGMFSRFAFSCFQCFVVSYCRNVCHHGKVHCCALCCLVVVTILYRFLPVRTFLLHYSYPWLRQTCWHCLFCSAFHCCDSSMPSS